MTIQEVICLVRQIVAEELDVPLESLKDHRSLRKDYGLDSVAAVNIIFAIETKLGVDVDVREFASVDSIVGLRECILKNQSLIRNVTEHGSH